MFTSIRLRFTHLASRFAVVFGLTACSLAPPIDHEQQGSEPTGWRMSGGGREELRKRGDKSVLHEGRPTLRLAPIADSSMGYGTWMNALFAYPYRGKRIRISAYTRTAGANRRADFWARVQAKASPGDGNGLVGKFIALPASSDWQRYEIVFDVPREGAWIHYGVGLAGSGMLWLDRATIEVVDREVPITSGLQGRSMTGS